MEVVAMAMAMRTCQRRLESCGGGVRAICIAFKYNFAVGVWKIVVPAPEPRIAPSRS